jgi:hypothetical protein
MAMRDLRWLPGVLVVALLAGLLGVAPLARADTSGWLAELDGGQGAGAQGSKITIMCPGGSFLVGLNARTGARIDHVQPLCVNGLPDGHWDGTPFPAPGNGMGSSAGGGDNNVVCPQNYFVERIFFGRYGNEPWNDIWLYRLRLVCSTISAAYGEGVDMAGLFQPPQGFHQGAMMVTNCWKLGTKQGENVANGLLAVADQFVNQLAVYCIPFGFPPAVKNIVRIPKPKILDPMIAEGTPPSAVVAQPKLAKSLSKSMIVAAPSTSLSSQLLQQQDTPPVSGAQTTQMATTATGPQRFEKPTGPNGLRLYACPTVGSDDCASKQVADLFCTQHSSAASSGFDTSREKVAAETLQGEACDKKKCKVFDIIVCQ